MTHYNAYDIIERAETQPRLMTIIETLYDFKEYNLSDVANLDEINKDMFVSLLLDYPDVAMNDLLSKV